MRVAENFAVLSPDDVWHHYDQLVEALDAYRVAVMERMRSGDEIPAIFHNSSIEDVWENFELLGNELLCWSIMNSIANAEAIVQRDYLHRINKRKKDPLSRLYRAMYSKSKLVRLKDIILEWPKATPSCRPIVNRFIDILRIRNWIAHGRYYTLRGKLMDIETIRTRIEELLNCGVIAN
jgi:hypothetical protein